MGERQDLGEKDPAEMRREIDDTRASIGEKLEALEDSVKNTAADARDSVLETYEDVKRNFSLSHHVQERPWTMFAGSIGLGFVVGSLLSNKLHDHSDSSVGQPSFVTVKASGNGHGTNGHHAPAALKAKDESPGLLSHPMVMAGLSGLLAKTFGPDLRKAREVALGTVLGVVRELAREAVPASYAERTANMIDEVTRHLGGQPVGSSSAPTRPVAMIH